MLNEKQLEMCETSKWDFSDLKALFNLRQVRKRNLLPQ